MAHPLALVCGKWRLHEYCEAHLLTLFEYTIGSTTTTTKTDVVAHQLKSPVPHWTHSVQPTILPSSRHDNRTRRWLARWVWWSTSHSRVSLLDKSIESLLQPECTARTTCASTGAKWWLMQWAYYSGTLDVETPLCVVFFSVDKKKHNHHGQDGQQARSASQGHYFSA